jgi:ribosome recycling factor
MNEEIEFILDSTKEAMVNALKHLEKQFINIRAGKASPSMLGSVMVDYYGTKTPLSQVANVNTPDGRTITVQPWEKAMLQEIECAIMVANLGFNPMNNGETIIINVPPLTWILSCSIDCRKKPCKKYFPHLTDIHVRTIVATRALNTGDSNDYVFTTSSRIKQK